LEIRRLHTAQFYFWESINENQTFIYWILTGPSFGMWRKTGAVRTCITYGREAPTEYEPFWPGKGTALL
jgi:hypothetical protein